LISKKWSAAVFFASLLFITRPNGIVLSVILFWCLFKAVRDKSLSVKVVVLYALLAFIPYIEWLYFCYLNTGDPLYWQKAFSLWYPAKPTFNVIMDNIGRIFSIWSLPIHGYHYSKLDTLMVIAIICFLLVSKSVLSHNCGG
jgi:multisubunit Na+/H+ antiporter MnhF subunit